MEVRSESKPVGGQQGEMEGLDSNMEKGSTIAQIYTLVSGERLAEINESILHWLEKNELRSQQIENTMVEMQKSIRMMEVVIAKNADLDGGLGDSARVADLCVANKAATAMQDKGKHRVGAMNEPLIQNPPTQPIISGRDDSFSAVDNNELLLTIPEDELSDLHFLYDDATTLKVKVPCNDGGYKICMGSKSWQYGKIRVINIDEDPLQPEGSIVSGNVTPDPKGNLSSAGSTSGKTEIAKKLFSVPIQGQKATKKAKVIRERSSKPPLPKPVNSGKLMLKRGKTPIRRQTRPVPKGNGFILPKYVNSYFRPTVEMDLTEEECHAAGYIFSSNLDLREDIFQHSETRYVRQDFFCIVPGNLIESHIIELMAMRMTWE